MRIESPFNSAASSEIIKKINVQDIVDAYKTEFATDIRYIFKDLKEIYICKCPITSLEFFYPRDLDGDSAFYGSLSKRDWYYQEERWEYSKAIEFIQENNSILEIGSGGGAFIKKLINSKRVKYCGLELNEQGVLMAKQKGVDLTNELLSNHVVKNESNYNVVCSFQVFEHISQINDLFKDSIKCLSKDGLLIVSVPNNGVSFLKNNTLVSRYLNMPPHHMNLFTEESILKIAKLNNLSVVRILKEPIQNMHVDVYLNNVINRLFFNSTIFTRIFWKLKLHTLLRWIVRSRSEKIAGHTIMCVLKKSN